LHAFNAHAVVLCRQVLDDQTEKGENPMVKKVRVPSRDDEEEEVDETTNGNAGVIDAWVDLREKLLEALHLQDEKKLRFVGEALMTLGGKDALRHAFVGASRSSALPLVQVWSDIAEDWHHEDE
jgi:hypothetical protein